MELTKLYHLLEFFDPSDSKDKLQNTVHYSGEALFIQGPKELGLFCLLYFYTPLVVAHHTSLKKNL